MTSYDCPLCEEPLPQLVVDGSPPAILNCPGCGFSLTCGEGRVMPTPPARQACAAEEILERTARQALRPPTIAPAVVPVPKRGALRLSFSELEPLVGELPGSPPHSAPLAWFETPARPEGAAPVSLPTLADLPGAPPDGGSWSPVSGWPSAATPAPLPSDLRRSLDRWRAAAKSPLRVAPPRTGPRSRRYVALGWAAVGVLVLAGSSWAIAERVTAARPADEPVLVTMAELPLIQSEPAASPSSEEEFVSWPEVTPPGAPRPPKAPAPRVLGGKRVVLDYELRPLAREPEPAFEGPAANPNATAVALAHQAYQRGNSLLLGGDAGGAEAEYLQALDLYPGFVAGYRGLGFAYAEQGDDQKALSAFKLYVSTVPNARDTPVLLKRIKRLER